ncbi:MAG: DUF2723 domain-containing protein [Candidatus Latescibacteria bacterium]|nr:DUF2723 domain-containing protein [Candidatus Latescibacterota bacterium]
MQVSDQLNRWVGVGVFGAALGLYLKTMAPTVSFWDCGEFIAASYTLGVPHPPGSPLYILLGRLFSLAPIGEVAARINFMSALASALAVWCVFLSTLVLARRALGGAGRALLGDGRDWAVLGGALVAAGALAASYTFWYNASEAEVYGYSLLFVCLGVWLVLYWESGPMGAGQDRWLFVLAYAFGLGGGLHLLCLLTIPALLIWAWFADEGLRRPMIYLSGFGLWAMVVVTVMGSTTGGYLIVGVSLAGLLYHLYQRDRRAFGLVLGLVVLFLLGYSTYGALFIRSGLDPVIDENDPETWAAFVKFLNREQYGTDSQLLGMFSARADRGFQFWDLQTKYFLQQFPFPLLEIPMVFRRATEAAGHAIQVSVLPYLLGLGGLLWHAGRDRRRFFGVLALFVIMGFGLSMYLNMPDPQPRERHYVFGGMFFAFALWMGLGWTGLVVWLGERLPSRGLVAVVAVLGLIWPVGMVAKQYHEQDRTGDYIAYDYAYNILQSCDEGAILFTNGDNDTFPLWFLQEVEGIRRDVRVVNLSLLNTNWYIKQLRDREPKIAINLDDTFIDSTLTDTTYEDLIKRAWFEPKVPQEFRDIGLDVEVTGMPGYDILRVQDQMIIGILRWNEWRRPVYFAITVAASNRVNLEPYLRMEGMVLKLVRERDLGPDTEELARHLFEVYQFRSIDDSTVFKDDNTERLLGNYNACLIQLADLYQSQGRGEDVARLMRWGQERLDFNWYTYHSAAGFLKESGQMEMAAEFLGSAGTGLLKELDKDFYAYDNVLAVAALLVRDYQDFARAEALYRAAIEHRPERWDAYYELAATMQAGGDVDQGVALLRSYTERYGSIQQIVEAEKILLQAQAQQDSAAAD